MSGLQLKAGHGAVFRASHPEESRVGLEIPSVMVSLSEPPSIADAAGNQIPSTAVWKIQIEAKTETTRKVLGVVHTLPPPLVGGNSNRVVALATCPGAISWDIQASLVAGTGTDDSEAILDLASSPCCGTLGIIPLFAALQPFSGQLLFSSTAGPNPVILSAAQRLSSLSAVAGLLGGTVTIVSPAQTIVIPLLANASFSADFEGDIIGPGSVTFSAGISAWVLETIL